MVIRSDARRWTYADLAEFPENGKRYEIIGGELYVTPVPSPFHQYVIGNLVSLLRPLVVHDRFGWACLGPIGVRLADDDYVEPDFVFVRRERMGIVGEQRIEGTPDLVVEVASEVTAERDRGIKRECYGRHGVREYWVVDSGAGVVEVYRSDKGSGGPEITPGILLWKPMRGGSTLKLPVLELFANVH